MLTKRLLIWVMGTAVLSVIGQNSTASRHETLRGLVGIHVVVNDLNDASKQAGLTTTQIKTDVELRLRQAGIKVLNNLDSMFSPGAAGLVLSITTVAIINGNVIFGYAFSVQVRLIQRVNLSHNRHETFAATWINSGIRIDHIRESVRGVRQFVRDEVDGFINEYLSINPN